MKFFLPILFFCLSANLLAQDHHFQLNIGQGQSSLFNAQTQPGLGSTLALEYHRSLSLKTGFFIGAGIQYTNFEDQSITQPCNFPFGLKVVTFNTTEFYEVHRMDLTLNLGLTHRVGKFMLRGSLLPTMRLTDKIDAQIIQRFSAPNRPSQELGFSIKPGERFNPEGPVEYTVDYTDKVQLQGEIGLTYAIEQQVQLGIAYRHGLTQYELQYKTVGYCGEATCEEVNIVNSRIDARTGHAYITLGFSF